MNVDMTVMLDKDVLDIVVVKAMSEAGMTFQQRMQYGPTISNSILKQAAEDPAVFKRLYHITLQKIVFD